MLELFLWCSRKNEDETIFLQLKCCILTVGWIIEVLLRLIILNESNIRLDGHLSMKVIDKEFFLLSGKGFFFLIFKIFWGGKLSKKVLCVLMPTHKINTIEKICE